MSWSLVRDNGGAVRTMMPEKPVKLGAATPEESTRQFFLKYSAALQGSGNEAELTAQPDEGGDVQGLKFVKFGHVVPGTTLPVFDSETFAAFTPEGEMLFANAGFHPGIESVETSPKLAESDALANARKAADGRCGAQAEETTETQSRLGVVAEGVPSPRLAYRVTLGEYEECHSPQVTIDAITGAVLGFADGSASLIDANAKGVHFHAKGEQSDVKTVRYEIKNGKNVLEAPAIRGTNESWLPKIMTRSWTGPGTEVDIEAANLGAWDDNSNKKGAAVDAHYHTERALEFFRTVFQRRGIDTEGTRDVLLIVHDNTLSNGQNAWKYQREGVSYKRGALEVVSVGDGGNGWLPVSSYDVLVHELTHGITRNTSNLVYASESGALNEAFSDVMAASAEYWIQSSRSPLVVAPKPTIIGERVTENGKGIRDMVDPQSFGDADHYANIIQCAPNVMPDKSNDFCGVHSNSGIANRAWSLMALGGVHGKSGIRVPAIGWERAARLWYGTMTRTRSVATMKDVAAQMVTRATLYGADAVISTACAWHAVGVGDFKVSGFTTSMCGRVAAATPKLPFATCNGVAFGYVCNDNAMNSAYVCVNGSIFSSATCQDPTKICKKRAKDDWTATYDVVNGLACE